MATRSGGAQERDGADGVVRIGARRPPWRLAVGSVLRDWRTDQGLRLSDVAERGRKEPSSEVLGAVTQALGGSLTDLALGVARHLAATDGRRRTVASGPARIAQVRELRALTTPATVSRVEARDTVQRDVLLLAA